MALRKDRSTESFNAFGANTLPGHLGMRVSKLEEGLAVLEFDVVPQLMAPNGFLHAGSVVALADTAAGYACLAHLPEEATSFTTIELKANFLGTARAGVVRAEARSVHLGRTTQLWDATVYSSASDKPIAHFRCTQLVVYPKKA
jgi:1,4-dihydroxy-2-naphthoyl-CoA hydrolase